MQDCFTPLMEAARSGNEEIARLLLSHEPTPPNICLRNDSGQTAADLADANGHHTVANLIAAFQFPLLRAAWTNDVDRCKQILADSPPDVNACVEETNRMFNAAHVAVMRGHSEVLDALLQAGVDASVLFKQPNAPSQSLLELAVSTGHSRIVQCLVRSGAVDVNAKNVSDGATAVHLTAATCFGSNRESRAATGDGKEQSEEYETKIGKFEEEFTEEETHKRRREFERILVSLLNADADPNIRDKTGRVPLHCAAQAGNRQIAKLLCEKGADVNAIDQEGMSPLMYAVQRDHVELIVLMIQCYANLEKADRDGKRSVLDLAVEYANKQDDDRILKALRNNFVFQQAKFTLWKELKNVKRLSSGNFGITYQGELIIAQTWKGDITLPVVMKVSKAETGADEWHELRTLQNLPPNRHVLSLLGICTNFSFNLTSDSETAMIVPFKCGGSLRAHLDDRKGHLPYVRMVELGLQMARGVLHLHENGYKHNDIAARNFLLSEPESEEPEDTGGEGATRSAAPQCVVLTDFGLTRAANYKEKKPVLIPWRWAAPEALRSSGRDSSLQSDIWMLGVTFWELLGIKAPPAHHIHLPLHVLQCYVSDEVPLFMPSWTPDAWRALVFDCCSIAPEKRPRAEAVVDRLSKLLSELQRSQELGGAGCSAARGGGGSVMGDGETACSSAPPQGADYAGLGEEADYAGLGESQQQLGDKSFGEYSTVESLFADEVVHPTSAGENASHYVEYTPLEEIEDDIEGETYQSVHDELTTASASKDQQLPDVNSSGIAYAMASEVSPTGTPSGGTGFLHDGLTKDEAEDIALKVSAASPSTEGRALVMLKSQLETESAKRQALEAEVHSLRGQLAALAARFEAHLGEHHE